MIQLYTVYIYIYIYIYNIHTYIVLVRTGWKWSVWSRVWNVELCCLNCSHVCVKQHWRTCQCPAIVIFEKLTLSSSSNGPHSAAGIPHKQNRPLKRSTKKNLYRNSLPNPSKLKVPLMQVVSLAAIFEASLSCFSRASAAPVFLETSNSPKLFIKLTINFHIWNRQWDQMTTAS